MNDINMLNTSRRPPWPPPQSLTINDLDDQETRDVGFKFKDDNAKGHKALVENRKFTEEEIELYKKNAILCGTFVIGTEVVMNLVNSVDLSDKNVLNTLIEELKREIQDLDGGSQFDVYRESLVYSINVKLPLLFEFAKEVGIEVPDVDFKLPEELINEPVARNILKSQPVGQPSEKKISGLRKLLEKKYFKE